MSLTKYKAFVTVVDHGSFTKAAKIMGYSQPGISKMVYSLEDELEITLFTKSNASLQLTENGEQIYVYCKEILKHYEAMIEATNAMKGLLTGSLRIGAVNSIILDFVPHIIKSFTSAYPIIQLRLDELSYGEIIDELKDNTLDIGFTSEFTVPGIEFIPLFKDESCLIVNKEHPFASQDRISIDALNGIDMIMAPIGGDDVINAVKKTLDFTPVAKNFIHSDAAAISMVASGLGSYILSEMHCRNLPDNVVCLKFKEKPCRTMGIGIRTHKITPRAQSEMIKIAKQKAKELKSSE